MRLRNKKTGEIMDDAQYRNFSLHDGFGFRNGDKEYYYHSLAELNAEWEDVPEDTKDFWYIRCGGAVKQNEDSSLEKHHIDKHKEIGNYFSTREEAEKVVERLRAWKRLVDKGFRFTEWGVGLNDELTIKAKYNELDIYEDMNLLFRGGE